MNDVAGPRGCLHNLRDGFFTHRVATRVGLRRRRTRRASNYREAEKRHPAGEAPEAAPPRHPNHHRFCIPHIIPLKNQPHPHAVMFALSPPVAAKLVPLTIRAPSDARKTTSGAMSSGSTQGTPSGSFFC